MALRSAALAFALALTPLLAQDCSTVATYSPCDLVYEMTAAEAAQHPNPYLTVTLHAEFRSPRFRTVMMPGFWDGGRRFVIRVTPIDPGAWTYRVTSNLASITGKEGTMNATDSGHPGFIRPDNRRAWSTTETRSPHLWMGDTSYRFAWLPDALFDQLITARAAQQFNHIRGFVMNDEPQLRQAYVDPDHPNFEHFQILDKRIRAMNQKGIFADLILGGARNQLTRMFPEREQRERYIKYVVSRYAPMMITWQGLQEFEEYDNGRVLLGELNATIMKWDPYKQPRSTHTTATSAPLLEDKWMTHIMYQTAADSLLAVERQIFFVPMINSGFGYEDSGAGKSRPLDVDSDTFRKRLWTLTMDGQYPTYGNTGTLGDGKSAVDAKFFESPGTKVMAAWYELFSKTRHWELEPYFDISAGKALALGGIEYIVYLEQPGPVELTVEKKKYEVYWMRPSTGEIVQEKKDFKGSEKFIGQPPDNNSDWVLHLSRDGRKEGMAKSWKFESRPIFQQEIERAPAKVPFEIEAPLGDSVPVGKPVQFAVKLTRETKASKAMQYLWTVEATNDKQGYRVLGTSQKGEFTIPTNIARSYPAVMNVRVYGLNGNGKLYALDRVVKATE